MFRRSFYARRKGALVRRQIEALAAAVASRNIRHVWVVACGGSLATLDPFRYILTAETDKVSAAAVNAAEFAAELPKGLGEDCLVVLNSQKRHHGRDRPRGATG